MVSEAKKEDSVLFSRLEMLAEQKKNEQKIGYKVLELLLSQSTFVGTVSREVADFFYTSDISDAITDDNLDFCKKLVSEHADARWFWLISESYHGDGEDFNKYCAAFEKYYNENFKIEMVYEKYQNSSSVLEMDEKLINTKESIDENIEEDIEKSTVQNLSPVINEDDNLQEADRDRVIEKIQEENILLVQCIFDMRSDMKSLYKKMIQYKRELMDKELEYKEQFQTIKDVGTKLKVHSEKNKLLMGRITMLESINSRLYDENAEKEKLYQELAERCDKLSKEKSELETKNKELYFQINIQHDKEQSQISGKEEVTENIVENKNNVVEQLEDGETKIQEKVDVPEETSEDGSIPMTSNLFSIKKKSKVFARLFSRYHESKFMKKTLTDQESMIFIKMMELGFDKEKVVLVKKMMRGDAKISIIELYKIIAKNPSIEELNSVYAAASIL